MYVFGLIPALALTFASASPDAAPEAADATEASEPTDAAESTDVAEPTDEGVPAEPGDATPATTPASAGEAPYSKGVGTGLLISTAVVGGTALGVTIARSVLLYRVRVTRGLAIEVALSLGGLMLASWFAAPGMLGGSLALWGFFLAQSLYFPLSAATPRRRARG